MLIAVAGLGYVGTVTAACLAESGHEVVGLDPNETKVRTVTSGHTPVADLGLEELVARNVAKGRLSATTDIRTAFGRARLVIVCVGTPSGRSGDVSLRDLLAVSRDLGRTIEERRERLDVLVTSTIPPGTLRNHVLPAIEESTSKSCGTDFGLAFAPEFLREGSAVADFLTPPKTVFGVMDGSIAPILQEVYEPFAQKVFITAPEVAESVKLVDNAWHALKVTFGNEIGRFCAAYSVDAHEVMKLFKEDRKLNISERYLTPGWSFGGSCLPKDLRTLQFRAASAGVRVPVLSAILDSNGIQTEEALSAVEMLNAKRILVVGIAFKSGTDDLRESPALALVERLLGKGYDVTVYDEYVHVDRLVGANKDYVLSRLPHIVNILATDARTAVEGAEAVIFTQAGSAYSDVVDAIPPSVPVLDLGGSSAARRAKGYQGLSWSLP